MTNGSPASRAVAPGLLRLLVLFHESDALGAGLSVLRALDGLRAHGWSISGWFPRPGPLVELASDSLASVHIAEKPIAVSRRGWREDPGMLVRLRRTPAYLRAVESAMLDVRPHVVHANTLHVLPEAALARRLGLPTVLQSHEHPRAGPKREAAVFAAARLADVLVGVSDAVSSMLRRHALRTPVHTVRNGVPYEETVATVGGEPFTVGSIGTVSRVKGTDVFLRAARLVAASRPDIRFEHVGSADLHRDERLAAEIAELLEDDGVRNAVTMLGSRPARDVLPSWSTFVCTSRSEGFPLATLEAMAFGVPVVATSVGGVPEQIEHLVTGALVPAEDVDEIAAWIIRLHDDADLRTRLGAEGRVRVAEEFTIERQARGLHGAYLTALALRFGPSRMRREARLWR